MSKTRNKTLVSLGISCQTTHQLRRLTNAPQQAVHASSDISAPSGLFDWLICPVESTINLLDQRIPDFSKSDIRIHKGRAYWANFDLYLWHSFFATDQEHRYVDINKTFEQELARWCYLRDRFSVLDPAHTVFVISNTQNNLETEVFDKSERDRYHFTGSMPAKLRQSLAGYFKTNTNNIHLQVVTHKERASGLDNISQLSFLPTDNNEWKGSKQSWDQWWQQLDLSHSG